MSDKLRSKRVKTIITIITIAALALLVFAVRDQLANTIRNLTKVNVWLVLLVFPLQVANHFVQGKLYQGLFRILGERFKTRSMFRLSLELNFVNTVFPSGGVSGFSYLSLRLKSEKISTAQATLVQIMRFVMIFVSFQVLLFVGLLFLAIGGQANDFVLLVSGSVATLVLIATFSLAFIIGSKRRIKWFFTSITRFLNRLIHVFRPNHPETINLDNLQNTLTELHEHYMLIRRNLSVLRWPLFFALMASVTEIAGLYVVYLAFSSVVNPGAVILGFAIANFSGLVSVLPGGVGIYEGLMTAVLAAGGVPPAVSLPVTIMYRVANMTAQLPPGYYFYHRNLHANSKLQHKMEQIKHDL